VSVILTLIVPESNSTGSPHRGPIPKTFALNNVRRRRRRLNARTTNGFSTSSSFRYDARIHSANTSTFPYVYVTADYAARHCTRNRAGFLRSYACLGRTKDQRADLSANTGRRLAFDRTAEWVPAPKQTRALSDDQRRRPR